MRVPPTVISFTQAELADVVNGAGEVETTRTFSGQIFEDRPPGRRLDTVHIHKLPIRCFKAPGVKGPSAEQIAAVFGQFGGLVRFQVVQTEAEGTLNFQLYLQYVSGSAVCGRLHALEIATLWHFGAHLCVARTLFGPLSRFDSPEATLRSMMAFAGRKLAQPLKAREFVAELRVDVDTSG